MIEIIEYEDNVITMDGLGEKMRKLRMGNGLSLLELSRRAYIAPSTIDKLEQGRCPTMYTVICLADALGYEVVMREKR